jgi:arginase family enzyme
MDAPFGVVYPEWQGCGRASAVQESTRRLAGRLFAEDGAILHAPSAGPETLEAEAALSATDGVVGLPALAARCKQVLDALRRRAPNRLAVVGGTCGVEVAPVAYCNERYAGDLAVLWLDGHADLNTPDASPSGHFHGMVLRTLLGDGPAAYTRHLRRPLRPEQVALVGVRTLDPAEEVYLERHPIPVRRGDAPDGLGWTDGEGLLRLVQDMGADRVYVHLDLDVLNPDAFPDTLMHVPGGPTPEAVARALRPLAETDAVTVVGTSVVEFLARSDRAVRHADRFVRATGLW